MHLVQSIVLAIEGVNDVILRSVDLIINIDDLFDKLNEFLHLYPEQLVNMLLKLISEDIDPLFTGPLLRQIATFGTFSDLSAFDRVLQRSIVVTMVRSCPWAFRVDRAIGKSRLLALKCLPIVRLLLLNLIGTCNFSLLSYR